MFAPYKVATWDDIPAELKDANGAWVNDYGGYMSIGYDAAKVPAPTSVDRPAQARVQGQGRAQRRPDPGRRGVQRRRRWPRSATAARPTTSPPGVDFFGQLKEAGNFLPVDPTPATIESGQTPVVIDWDYLNVAQAAKLKGKIDWKIVVPANAVVGSYYIQAINKDAPHPAAARLWQEFLYSDEGQNLWLKGGARPVRADAMEKAGTHRHGRVRRAAAVTEGTPVFLTEAQTDKAKEYLAANWAKAVG